MGKSVNKCLFLGHVGKDPEIRSTPSGAVVANFSLALSGREKDQQGNWQDKTEWVNLVAFQKTAEIVRDYVKKGSKIFVESKVSNSSWTDKQSGEKKYKTEYIVNDISLLSGKDEGGGRQESSPASSSAGGYAQSSEINEEDCPF